MKTFSLVLITIFFFSLNSWALSLSDVHRDYLYGNYEEAIKKAKGLRESPEVLHFLGLAYIKTGNYLQARVFLKRLIRNCPNSEFYDQGLIKLADSYFLQKNYSRAKELYEKILEKYPEFSNRSLVLLRLAQIASRQGDWQVKRQYIKTLKAKYPRSSEMRFVEILESYGDFFTIQVGAFAEKKNAFSLKEELSQDYKPYIIEEIKNNYPIYKVRIGKYKNRYDVQKTQAILLKEGYPASIYP